MYGHSRERWGPLISGFEFGANVSPWQRSAQVPSGVESRGVESCVLHSPPDHGRFRFGAEDIDKEMERYFNVQGTAYCCQYKGDQALYGNIFRMFHV